MVLDPVRAVTDRLDAVIVSQAEPLEAGGRTVQGWIATAFRFGGSAGQSTKNVLNGVWLGHPLHPALTDVPIGAWTTSLIFDLLGLELGRLAEDVADGVGREVVGAGHVEGTTVRLGEGRAAAGHHDGFSHGSFSPRGEFPR